MKKKILLTLLVTLLLTGCTSKEVVEPTTTQQTTQTKEPNKEIVLTDNMDSMDKACQMIDYNYDNKNILMSPLSIDIAIGMAGNGTNDPQLKEQLNNYFGCSVNDYNNFMEYYLEDEDETIKIANALFLNNKTSKPLTQYTDILKDKYDAQMESVPFNQEGVDIINSWCAEKTNNMIPSILNELDDSKNIFLINALYFDKNWESPFNENSTDKQDFTNINGETTKVDMMHSMEETYIENDQATGFIKYYEGMDYYFVGILPKTDGEFDVANLDLNSLLASKTTEYDVQISMPKFTFDYDVELTNTLKAMGLKGLFESKLDVIIPDENCNIDSVLHKTKIEVDEKGTKAAAVTGMLMCTTSMPEEKEMKEINLNRPFVFLIIGEKQINNNIVETPLFIGKVVDLQ